MLGVYHHRAPVHPRPLPISAASLRTLASSSPYRRARYSDAAHWKLVTPYHEKRNIHFYVNKCGFHITEYYNDRHPDPHYPQEESGDYPGEDGGLFKFEKLIG